MAGSAERDRGEDVEREDRSELEHFRAPLSSEGSAIVAETASAATAANFSVESWAISVNSTYGTNVK